MLTLKENVPSFLDETISDDQRITDALNWYQQDTNYPPSLLPFFMKTSIRTWNEDIKPAAACSLPTHIVFTIQLIEDVTRGIKEEIQAGIFDKDPAASFNRCLDKALHNHNEDEQSFSA